MSKSEQFCFLLLLGLMFWLPIPLASNRIWAWSIAEIIVATQTIVLFGFNFKKLAYDRLVSFWWLIGALVVFQAWVLIQIIPMPIELLRWVSSYSAHYYQSVPSAFGTISLDPYATQVGLIKGVTYTLFAINSILLISSLERVRWVLYTLVASGTFQAFYGAIIVLLEIKHSLIFNIHQGHRVTGSFVYYNHLANYLMMCLCLGFGLIISQMHHSRSGTWRVRLERWLEAAMSPKMLLRLCLIIMVIALVMTRSRMGNAAFFTVTLVGGTIAMLFYKDRPRALTVFVLSIIVIDTVVVGSLFGLEKVKQRLEATSAMTETRDQVVAWGMDIIKDVPFTGTGLGSFYSTFPSYTHYNIGYYNYAHNDYLQFSSEVGIPATLLLGCAVIFALVKSFQALRTRKSKTLKGTAIGCLMAIIGQLIHISVDFNLQSVANSMTFILILVLAGISGQLVIAKRKQNIYR